MKIRQIKIIFLTVACIFTSSFILNSAYAYTQPAFFSCLNPQGDIQVTHTDGVHGVPGGQPDQPGVDTVYSESGKDILSSSTVVQCLCPINGQGTQTNWWKATDLSGDEIKVLESQGWIYIPDGSAWGLDPDPYMAQNSGFSCPSSGSNSNQGSTNGGSKNNNTNTNGSSTSNNANSNDPSDPLQSVLGTMTELAFTGNSIFLYSLLAIGIVASSLAIILRKNK